MKKVLAKVTNVLVICYDYSIIEEYEENVIKSKKITIKDKLRKRERREIFMLSLESDYTKGAHKKILERLCEINMEPQPGMEAICIVNRQARRSKQHADATMQMFSS